MLFSIIAQMTVATLTGAAAPTITWSPETPASGQAFVIRVALPESLAARPGLVVRGYLEEWDLIFERGLAGGYFALTAAPVGARELDLDITVILDGDSTVYGETIMVGPGRFGADTLRVASQFGQTPDSATQARIARERRESERVRLVAAVTPRIWSGPFLRPRPSRVTSSFGRARVFNGSIRSRHWGVDLDGATGDSVFAANAGIVELVADHYYSGNAVHVNHGAGLVTAYLHLSETRVEVGQQVERGDLLGLVGSTGRVTGPHLHWSARLGPVLFNPLTLLDELVSDLPAPLNMAP